MVGCGTRLWSGPSMHIPSEGTLSINNPEKILARTPYCGAFDVIKIDASARVVMYQGKIDQTVCAGVSDYFEHINLTIADRCMTLGPTSIKNRHLHPVFIDATITCNTVKKIILSGEITVDAQFDKVDTVHIVVDGNVKGSFSFGIARKIIVHAHGMCTIKIVGCTSGCEVVNTDGATVNVKNLKIATPNDVHENI